MAEVFVNQDLAKVLILEDEPSQLQTLSAILQDEEFCIIGCTTFAEARNALKYEPIAVMIVDLCLPDLGTLELLAALEPWSRQIPIIVNTAYGSYESAREAVNLGAFAYIEKAGDPEALVRQVHRAYQEHLKRYASELEQAVAQRTEDLQQANQQLKALASELTLTEERLRRSVATELHDQVSQTLAVCKLKISSLCASVSDETIRQTLSEISQNIGDTLRDARALTSRLSYPTLQVLGYEMAVEKWLTDEVGTKYGIRTHFKNDGQAKPLSEDVSAVLFRGTRELLMNAIKHAQATEITVSISRQDNTIVTTISDDGIGGDPQNVIRESTGFGLLSVQEALERLGGYLRIESPEKVGLQVTMYAPIDMTG